MQFRLYKWFLGRTKYYYNRQAASSIQAIHPIYLDFKECTMSWKYFATGLRQFSGENVVATCLWGRNLHRAWDTRSIQRLCLTYVDATVTDELVSAGWFRVEGTSDTSSERFFQFPWVEERPQIRIGHTILHGMCVFVVPSLVTLLESLVWLEVFHPDFSTCGTVYCTENNGKGHFRSTHTFENCIQTFTVKIWDLLATHSSWYPWQCKQ